MNNLNRRWETRYKNARRLLSRPWALKHDVIVSIFMFFRRFRYKDLIRILIVDPKV